MAEQPALSFAGLLRRLRGEARLTQEELAEAASLSPRSVSDLERGISRTARKDTAVLLAGALSLTGPQRELFVAAARGRAPAAQVLAARAGAATGAPPPARRHNLPAQVSRFIGRDRELAEVRALVESSRLVTLTGAGGCGKTRLSLQLAAGLLGGSGDGVWLVELAAVSDGDAVAPAISQALRLAAQPGPALETLLDALASQRRHPVNGLAACRVHVDSRGRFARGHAGERDLPAGRCQYRGCALCPRAYQGGEDPPQTRMSWSAAQPVLSARRRSSC